ncbi:MAG: prenyltransferase [bacterium]
MSVGNWVEIVRTCNLQPEKKMDVVSKWLIIVRACVFPITILSAAIGGLLAANDGRFHAGHFALVTLALVVAHAANNMVNDLFDVIHGVDTKDYHRANYAPHPILGGLTTKQGLIGAIALCNVIDLAVAFYLSSVCGWTVMAFAVVGLATSVFYVAPPLKLKHRGLGEPAIFLIWGPLMIGGTYFVMAGSVPTRVWLASVPYGLAITASLMGKHLDKAEKDRAKGVRTLPVVLGDRLGRKVTQLMVWGFYLGIVWLAASGGLPLWSLLTLGTLPAASRFIETLGNVAPETPQEAFRLAADVIPADLKKRVRLDAPVAAYPLWPLWYVAWGMWWGRYAGGAFVLGLVIAALT